MPSFRAKNRLTQVYIEKYTSKGMKFSTFPAVSYFTDKPQPYLDYAYSDNLDEPRFRASAVKVVFENGPVLYLDSDEVIF